MRMSFVLLVIAASLAASTDAVPTSTTSVQAKAGNLVLPNGDHVTPQRHLRKRKTDLYSEEERGGDLLKALKLPSLVDDMMGKPVMTIIHNLQYRGFTIEQQQAFFKLYNARIQKLAEAAEAEAAKLAKAAAAAGK